MVTLGPLPARRDIHTQKDHNALSQWSFGRRKPNFGQATTGASVPTRPEVSSSNPRNRRSRLVGDEISCDQSPIPILHGYTSSTSLHPQTSPASLLRLKVTPAGSEVDRSWALNVFRPLHRTGAERRVSTHGKRYRHCHSKTVPTKKRRETTHGRHRDDFSRVPPTTWPNDVVSTVSSRARRKPSPYSVS